MFYEQVCDQSKNLYGALPESLQYTVGGLNGCILKKYLSSHKEGSYPWGYPKNTENVITLPNAQD